MVRVRVRPSADGCLEVDVLSAPDAPGDRGRVNRVALYRVGLHLGILSSMGYMRNWACLSRVLKSVCFCVCA